MGDSSECPVCKCELEADSTSDPVRLLACGHRVHEYCWTGICDHAKADDDGTVALKCPLCRLTRDDVARLEVEALERSAQDAARAEEAKVADSAAVLAADGPTSVGASSAAPTGLPAPGSVVSAPSTVAFPPPTEAAAVEAAPVEAEPTEAAPTEAAAVEAAAVEEPPPPPTAIVVRASRFGATCGAPTLVLPSVFCSTCGSTCKLDRCRIKDKSKGTFRCDICKCRVVQLYREYGTWPVDEFKNFNESEQQEFMKSIAGCNIQDIRAKVTEFITKHASQEDWYEEGGQYLPLSVWQNKGFPIDLIEQKSEPCDVMCHPILGQCYRLRILSKGNRGVVGWTRQHQMKASGQKRLTPGLFNALAPAASGGPAAGSGDATASEGGAGDGDAKTGQKRQRSDDESSRSSSSDSRSSSSSSDKKKKKKKAKKAKKDKKRKQKAVKKDAKKKKEDKAKEVLRQREDKATSKVAEAKKKNAQAVYEKLNPLLVLCGSTIAKPSYLQVPPIMKDPLELMYRELNEITRKVDKCRQDESKEMPDHVSCVKDIPLNQNTFKLNEA